MSLIELSKLLEVAENAARLGGAVLMDWRGRINAREKAPFDLVTEADVASQRAIKSFLKRETPSISFLGEESDDEAGVDESLDLQEGDWWVVDPLDGTTNYVHDLPGWCVSIGLIREGEPLIGCVYDPISESCYCGAKTIGAFQDGVKLRTSETQNLSEALVAVSLPASVTRKSETVERFLDIVETSQAIRRLGSAALNLCHLAAGRLDGYWASSVKIWDIAAGVVILREAGGLATDVTGEKLNIGEPSLIAGANRPIHQQLCNLVNLTAEPSKKHLRSGGFG